MKNLLLLILSFLFGSVNAQSTGHPDPLTGPVNSHSRSQVYKEIAQRRDAWDNPSSTWNFVDSATISHDQNGNQNIWLYYGYQSPNWDTSQRYTYIYDINNKLTSRVIDFWDTTTRAYVHNDQQLYTNDANGNNTHFLQQTWDTTTNNWLNVQQNDYTYNGLNQKTQSILQNWVSNNWQYIEKESYSYTAAGKIETDVTQAWSGLWVNNTKTTYTYLPNNLTDSIIDQNWDALGVVWQNNTNTKYQYDGNDNNTTQTINRWRNSSNSYDSQFVLHTYTYDSHKNVLSHVEKVFNATSGQMDNYLKYVWSFNTDNENDTFTQFTVNVTNDFIPGNKITLLYDANHNNIYSLNQFYNTTSLNYQNINRRYFYYGLVNSNGINEMRNDLGVTMFPNPANNSGTNIRFDNKHVGTMVLNIYDLNGRLVSTEHRNVDTGTNTITAADNLPTGIYTIQLTNTTNGKSSVMKLVKQ